MGGMQVVTTHSHCSFLKNFLTGAVFTLPLVYILLHSIPSSFLSYTNLAAFQAHRTSTSPPLPPPPQGI
uniref:Uncharacterized protein n=1 Tax=Aegilops tauschii subsp. strangulata TaxID=200361 RepID=A0A453R785_AEGTS